MTFTFLSKGLSFTLQPCRLSLSYLAEFHTNESSASIHLITAEVYLKPDRELTQSCPMIHLILAVDSGNHRRRLDDQDLRVLQELGDLLGLLPYLQHASRTVGKTHNTEACYGTTSEPGPGGASLS